MRVPRDRDLFAYLEGELGRSDSEEIARLAQVSPAVRHRLDELAETLRSLRGAVPDHDRVEVLGRVRAGIASGQRAPRPPARGRAWVGVAACIAAAAAAVAIVVRDRPDGPTSEPAVVEASELEGIRAKGIASNRLDRWVRAIVYRLPASSSSPLAVDQTLHVGDGVLVAYVNRDRAGFSHLMVVGVDGKGETYWIYPALDADGTDPQSIQIEPTRDPLQLPDVVTHDFPVGDLALYAVFSGSPLSVSTLESAVADLVALGTWDPARPPRLPLDGVGQHVQSLQVLP